MLEKTKSTSLLNLSTKRKKRFSLTLLEITVAFFLIGILLSSLWGMYHSYLVTYQKNQKTQTAIHRLLFLKERLDKLCMQVASSPSKEDKNSVFTPEEKVEGVPTVCFSYYHAPDPDPAFNGRVCSLLYMNSIKQMCLATWSNEKTPRIDILLQSVSSFRLNFFDPQTNLWREDWPDNLKHLPLWMRLNTEGKEPLELLFRLDSPVDPILYLED
jgi:hypothetical protein